MRCVHVLLLLHAMWFVACHTLPNHHHTCTLMNWPSIASGAWAVHSRGSCAGAKMTCLVGAGGRAAFS